MTSWQIVKVGNRTIRAKDDSVEIIVALRSQTTGAVLKKNDRLRVISRTIPAACPLTAIELQILRLLSQGLTYQQIARRRNRAESTIRSQLHTIYRKLDVTDRAQAVLKAVGEGWL